MDELVVFMDNTFVVSVQAQVQFRLRFIMVGTSPGLGKKALDQGVPRLYLYWRNSKDPNNLPALSVSCYLFCIARTSRSHPPTPR